MDFNTLLNLLTANLGFGAAGAIILFAAAVAVDDALGVAGALKSKTFAWDKLGSFLESQFGTKRAAIVAGAVLAAVVTAVGGALAGGVPIAQAAESVALSVAIAGSVAQFASVAADIVDKAKALFGK